MDAEITTVTAPEKKRRGRKPKDRTVQAAPDVLGALQSPEGQAAIAAIVARATEQYASELNVKRAEAGTSAQPGDMAIVRSLAVAINELNGQGKKVVPAEVMESRRNARIRMEELILHARATEQTPEYELKMPVYLDEVLVPPIYRDSNKMQKRTRIEWPRVPNEAMIPANAVARDIFGAFMESISGATPNVMSGQRPVLPDEQRPDGLRVLTQSQQHREAPHVGKPRGDAGLRVVGRHGEGEIIETNVLGSVAAPARQVA